MKFADLLFASECSHHCFKAVAFGAGGFRKKFEFSDAKHKDSALAVEFDFCGFHPDGLASDADFYFVSVCGYPRRYRHAREYLTNSDQKATKDSSPAAAAQY